MIEGEQERKAFEKSKRLTNVGYLVTLLRGSDMSLEVILSHIHLRDAPFVNGYMCFSQENCELLDMMEAKYSGTVLFHITR